MTAASDLFLHRAPRTPPRHALRGTALPADGSAGSAGPAEVAGPAMDPVPAVGPRFSGGLVWRRATGRGPLLPWAVTVLVCAVGVLLVGLSYRLAAQGARPDVYYGTFWAGMVPAVVVTARHVAGRHSPTTHRLWGILLLGLLTMAPKYLRNPAGPAYHDEYAHWRETLDVLGDGRLFHPNAVIPIVQFFPGTSALTSTVARISALDAWQAGVVVVATAHCVGLFAVYVLAHTCLRSPRAGGVAALVYALNPSAMYFDTQFAYESIAINLYLWLIALVAVASRERDRRRRFGLVVAAVLCAGGVVVTHHLTTVFLLATITLTFTVIAVRPWSTRRNPDPNGNPLAYLDFSRQTWWRAAVGTVVLAVFWVAFVARPTLQYLSPYLGSAVKQLAAVVSGHHETTTAVPLNAENAAAGRKVLAATAQPVWERLLTAAAPLLMMVISLRGLWVLRTTWRPLHSDTLALLAMGMVFFPSVPFLLAPMGAEGARRSWAFFYLGLSLMTAYVVTRTPAPRLLQPLGERGRTTLAGLTLAAVLVGNVGGGLNDPYRFPGPFRWGTDTRSATVEAQAVAQAVAQTVGPVRVVVDRYTGLIMVGYGHLQTAMPSAGFPAWELTQVDQDPTPSLAGMLSSSRYDYLVVDLRMAQERAFNLDNFGALDPLVGRPTPAAYLERLDHARWATRVLATDHLRVYRLNLPLLQQTVEGAR